MDIYLIRHAEAIERSPAIPEEHRYLTPRGRKRFREVAALLRRGGCRPDAIIASPLLRAIQTADILAEAIDFTGPLVASLLLAPGFTTDCLHQAIGEFPGAHEIALVGHEPDLGQIVGELLGLTHSCSLKKGSVVTLSLEAKGSPARGTLKWLVTGGGTLVDARDAALRKLCEG